MLRELYIKNYLMLPDSRLSFQPGLTVISGETGAGKSILVGSISLIFGDNAPGLEAYNPAQPIYLEATIQPNNDPFLVDLLGNMGINADEDIALARELGNNGKSTYFINGRKTSVAVIKELKLHLIDFHHQRDQQKLLNPNFQLDLLDAYAETGDLCRHFAALFQETKANLKSLQQMKDEAEKQQQLKELYQFQYDELESAHLKSGEETALQQQYELLTHAREITETAISVSQHLFEQENSVYDQINAALSNLSRFEELNYQLKEATQSLRSALNSIQDAAGSISGISDQLSADPQHLEAILARLDFINSLAYKHKLKNTADLIALQAQREQEIASFDSFGESIKALQEKLDKDYATLRNLADTLSTKRGIAIPKLRQELEQNIRELSIPNGQFEITIDKKAQPENLIHEFMVAVSETGQDAVQFIFSANSGFALKPLAAVASGGELSRILLAIKKVLAVRIPAKLVILDEIDAGIGGKTATRVAEFISALAQRQQVLVVTHLAQIAAFANSHWVVDKLDSGKREQVTIRRLAADDRLQELARMLSGKLSAKALEHAKELIKT